MERKYYKGIGALAMLLALNFQHIQAQEQPGRRARAEQEFLRMEYANAAQSYEQLVLDKKKPKTEDLERLAESYYYIKRYDLAENWFSRVVVLQDASQEAHLKYAEVLKQQGKYPEAKEQYRAYIGKYGASPEVERAIVGADSAAYWMQHPTKHQINNEQAINTALAEFGLTPTANGALYATEPNSILQDKSGMTGQSYLRVYSAERRIDGSLHYPNLMTESFNNSPYHVGPVAVNLANDVLFVTRTYAGKDAQKYKAHSQRWKKQNLELKIYRKNGETWTEEDFPYNNVKEYALGHAALNKDEKILYFASDMPGGQGGVDIWYCELQQDGSWGAPKNAGSQINTSGDEMFPSVEGDEFYFSSTGHIGMGGLDIFKATGAKSTFTVPVNMGYPVNSASDDFAFVTSMDDAMHTMGYLSSNRAGGVGSDDIYSFSLTKPRLNIELLTVVKDKKTGEILDRAVVMLYEENKVIARGSTDNKGEIYFDIDKGLAYRVYGEREGYMADSASFNAVYPRQDTTIYLTLNLQPVNKVGEKFVLENIYYDFDQSKIRPDAALILDKLVATMRNNSTLKIELSSHTDSRGAKKYNERLSQRRAQAAVDYIVGKGIERDRLVAKGYGESRLVNKCADGVDCTPDEHQANRRTEVEVIAY
ncbi:MAG: OmpA family protein [Sphingobacterium sp.]|jgi:outer membrane protein OmpA-like peptidoglycan-associated protein/tetratricopeptide (TPR) repeat protein|uniref:OmpA family protein n=1 Tax=Sphingobacterium tabacisoli TaxID=2044855 RepID=A0ABW5L7G7_9SPHI|nr:OmpA family protein [Sphingobacterium tabacisoli]MDR2285129.1 OmpA family protein [Sphingobacterium sp.]